MTERYEAVVVGAGQAGLSISHELTHAGVDHVVLERRRVAATCGAGGTASAWSPPTG